MFPWPPWAGDHFKALGVKIPIESCQRPGVPRASACRSTACSALLDTHAHKELPFADVEQLELEENPLFGVLQGDTELAHLLDPAGDFDLKQQLFDACGGFFDLPWFGLHRAPNLIRHYLLAHRNFIHIDRQDPQQRPKVVWQDGNEAVLAHVNPDGTVALPGGSIAGPIELPQVRHPHYAISLAALVVAAASKYWALDCTGRGFEPLHPDYRTALSKCASLALRILSDPLYAESNSSSTLEVGVDLSKRLAIDEDFVSLLPRTSPNDDETTPPAPRTSPSRARQRAPPTAFGYSASEPAGGGPRQAPAPYGRRRNALADACCFGRSIGASDAWEVLKLACDPRVEPRYRLHLMTLILAPQIVPGYVDRDVPLFALAGASHPSPSASPAAPPSPAPPASPVQLPVKVESYGSRRPQAFDAASGVENVPPPPLAEQPRRSFCPAPPLTSKPRLRLSGIR
ncbi:uncharacterized protein JCM10292_001419 [Rhodotorula paludigena]|uniref:uncharacterized protein n=1 Tax=Rhodotorula paludigena TaxID=86838 RepID=UPI003177652D